ncbi:hypothetical protein NYZ19_18700, partial [Acinetobacter baumannii]|nr:hypothetical protein [Acinetobacter baumannii]
AFDTWTDNPRLLNFSNEDSFVITAGGGSSGGGTGTGGSGGGYCPTTDTLILLANTDGTGPGTQKMAGDLNVGDRVWTQHEVTMEWG